MTTFAPITGAPIAAPPAPGKARFTLPPWAWVLLISFLASAAIVLPYAWLGSASGHDFEFHVASWLDTAYQWHEGTFYPRWTAWMNHSFGEPRFIFYPPFSWVLGAAVTMAAPDSWVPVAYIVLTQTFAGLSAFLLLRRLIPDTRAVILASAFYAANPNMLLIIYIRSDFAEQLALAFLPLLLLATLKLLDLIEDFSPIRTRILLFSLAFASIWLCNAPAAVVATYSVSFLMVWVTVAQGDGKFLRRGAAGLLLGWGLTAFYLIPAAYEQRWVNIKEILQTGMLPSENFLFTQTFDPEHTLFNSIASYTCVIVIVLLLGSALASSLFAKNRPSGKSPRVWNVLLMLGSCSFILTLSFTSLLWDYLPELRFMQFPWRWMSIISLVGACFLAAAAERRPRLVLWAPGLVLLLIFCAWQLVTNTWWDPDEMPTQESMISTEGGFPGVDEYDPIGNDHLALPLKGPQAALLPADPDGDSARAPLGRVDVQQWSTEHKRLRVRIATEGRVALRLLNYPAWRVTVNGTKVTPSHPEGSQQMIVPVPAGDSRVAVDFMRTPDRAIGLIVFSLSLLVVAVILLISAYG